MFQEVRHATWSFQLIALLSVISYKAKVYAIINSSSMSWLAALAYPPLNT